MRKYTLSIGLNDKDLHKQVIAKSKAIKIIQNCLISIDIMGSTIYEASGVYQGEAEKTIRVDLYEIKSEARLIKAIKEIKRKLNQNCIAIEKTNIVSKYI